MISLLAPTAVENVDPDSTLIIEMSRDVFDLLKATVEVGLEIRDSVPDAMRPASDQVWAFFIDGTVTP